MGMAGIPRNPREFAGMGTIIAGIPRGWNLMPLEIGGVCLENMQLCGF